MTGSEGRSGGRLWVTLVTLTLLSSGCASDGRERARDAWQLAIGSEARGSWVYPFERGQGSAVAVDLDGDGLVWPVLPLGADTLLLEVEIEARGQGQPALAAVAAGRSVVQYFVPGARGRRFVDLTPLRAGLVTGERLHLEGRGLAWRTGPSTLWAFENPSLGARRVLVLAPHPDDAEIAAYGVYASTDADVVTVTAGDAGGWNYRRLWPDDAGHHYRVKGEIRTWDSIAIPGLGGVPPERARNLGYYDATLRELWRRRPAVVPPPLAELETPDHYRRLNVDEAVAGSGLESSWPALVADLRRELERVRPEVVVTPHPFLDRHGDHQFTTIALIEALEGFDDEVELYLYTNHATEAELWPFGPADGVMGLPPSFDPELELDRIHSVPLDEEARRRKLIALEAMHDLRPFELDEPVPAGRHLRRFFVALGEPDFPDFRYFRRAPRPNELFFVLSSEGGPALRERFLHDLESRSEEGW